MVFFMFFGVVLVVFGSSVIVIVKVIEDFFYVMLKIIGYVMKLVLVVVFVVMVFIVVMNGFSIFLKFVVFMGDFYIGLIVLWGLLMFVGFLFFGWCMFKLLSEIKEVFLLLFVMVSLEVVYLKIFDVFDCFGVVWSIFVFVLLMGYLFNFDGFMMYCIFVIFFIV